LITKMMSLSLMIGALFDTVAADVLVVLRNFIIIPASRLRKRRSTAASADAADARAVDAPIDSRRTRNRPLLNWLGGGRADLL